MIIEQQKTISGLNKRLSNLQGKIISLKKDEVLYWQKDPTDSIYLIIKGAVELTRRNEKGFSISKTIKNEEFFGVNDFLENNHRSETAVALADTELLKIKLPQGNKDIADKNISDFSKIKTEMDLLISYTNTVSNSRLYKIHEVKNKKVISFYGHRGNLSNAVFFKNVIFSCIEEGTTNLIVDLVACKTIDSTFLGTLIASLKKISALGGSMKLVCDENICSWLFVMTEVDKVFEIYGNLEDALNS